MDSRRPQSVGRNQTTVRGGIGEFDRAFLCAHYIWSDLATNSICSNENISLHGGVVLEVYDGAAIRRDGNALGPLVEVNCSGIHMLDKSIQRYSPIMQYEKKLVVHAVAVSLTYERQPFENQHHD